MTRPDENIAMRHRFGNQGVVPLTKTGRFWLSVIGVGLAAFWTSLLWWLS